MRDPQAGPTTPRLRGVTHQRAFVASIFTVTALALSAPSPRARLPAIYVVSVVALFDEQRAISPCAVALARGAPVDAPP